MFNGLSRLSTLSTMAFYAYVDILYNVSTLGEGLGMIYPIAKFIYLKNNQ